MKDNNKDEKIFDLFLKVASEEAFIQEINSIPSCEELNKQYKPSFKINKKINNKIFYYNLKEKAKKLVKTFSKIVASLIIGFVLTTIILFNVEIFRNFIIKKTIN